MTQGAYILVKLLSGPNAGAEMELGPGDWILGSDDESHLLVLDAGVRAQHLLLHVEDSGELTLLPKNGTALVGGEALPPDGLTVPPFTVFTVGGTHMSHGPADETWPELGLPSLVVAEPVSENRDERKELAAPQAAASAEKVGDSPRKNTATANKVGGLPIGRVVLLAGLVLLLCGLVLDYTHLGIFFTDADREAATLARNLHRRGFANVAVTARPDGSFYVRGAVPSNATMDALVHYVERTDKNTEMSIISLEDLVAALQAQAKRLDAPLRITRSGTMLRISGYVYDMLALEEVLLEEREALAAVPVRIDVTSWDKAAKEVRSMLAARNLDAKVRVLSDLYHIILQSQPLSAAEQQALRVILRESEDIFGAEGVMLVERWRVTASPAPRPQAEARVMALAPTDPTAAPRPIQGVVQSPGNPAPKAETEPAAAKGEEKQAAPAQPAETRQPVARGPVESARVAEGLPSVSELPGLVAQQVFSCSQLRIVGQGHDMGVVYGGVMYKTGAKMPDNMQVKLITPGYVVLQRGKIHTRICTAGETAKEMHP